MNNYNNSSEIEISCFIEDSEKMSSENKNSKLSNGFEQSNDDHNLIDSYDMEKL